MMQEMLKGVGNNSTTSTPTTLTNNNNNNDNNLESSSRQKLRCPRCNSNNTKFCYYNNYNLTQPRHFCKSCRRYWTKGGTLRNIPIGGGCRKNKSSNVTAKAKAVLSTEMLLNGENKHNPVGFLGSGLLDRVPHHSELQLSGPTPVWPPILPGHNSSIIALLKEATHFFPNSISSTTTNTISSNIDTLGLHLDMYTNGAPTLFGSYPKSNDNPTHLLNEFGLFDETQRFKTLGNYSTYSSDENQRDAILGNLMTTSSSTRANLEESGGSLVSYGLKSLETSCWSQFS